MILLQAERLTLRVQDLADFPAYEALMASGRSKGMGGPFNTRAAWGMFCHDLANWHFSATARS